jgi:ABC-2 type transport system ATP-binding protein
MKSLSKGMAQRLCLARALLHDPEVLLLDEPAAGLDPKARVEFKRLVRILAGEGKTLLISSHILSELEEMCDVLLFVVDGRIVHHGAAEGLKTAAQEGTVLVVQVASAPDRLRAFVEGEGGALELLEETARGFRLRVDSTDPRLLAAVLRRMVQADVEVFDYRREERRLEDAFIERLESTGRS